MFLKKLLLATAVTTALAGAAVGITACDEETAEVEHVHEFTNWQTTKAATCTENDIETSTCSCGKSTRERQIPALGHSNLTATPEQEATCGNPGHRAYWTCSTCNQHFADAQGKRQVTLEEMTVTVAHSLKQVAGYGATCTAAGKATYYTCTVCNKNFTDETAASEVTDLNSLTIAPKHSATKVDGKAATCTEAGTAEYYTCKDCGKNFTDATCATEITDLVIPAKGHTAEKHEGKAATCTEAGEIEYYTCSECEGEFYDAQCLFAIGEESKTIAALGHDLHHVLGVAASCFHTGTTEHWACWTCHKRFDSEKAEEEIETYVIPESHELKGHIVKKVDSTCDKEGTKAHATCSECGKLFISEGEGKETDTFVAYTSKVQYERDLVIAKKPHMPDQDGISNPTKIGDDAFIAAHPVSCTQLGYAEFYWCQTCENCYKDKECTIDLGFNITNPENHKEALEAIAKENAANNGQGGPQQGGPQQGGPQQSEEDEAKKQALEEEKKYLKENEEAMAKEEKNVTEDKEGKIKWLKDKGLVVPAQGHLFETRYVKDDDGNYVETPFYHYDRTGHWLLCRRDCCKDHPRFQVDKDQLDPTKNGAKVEGVEETSGKAKYDLPVLADPKKNANIGTDIKVEGSETPKKVEASAHNFGEDGFCECGWVGGTNSKFATPNLNNSANLYKSEEAEEKLAEADPGYNYYYAEYWDLGENDVVYGTGSPASSEVNTYPKSCLDLTQMETSMGDDYTGKNIAVINKNALRQAYSTVQTVIIPWTVRYIEAGAFYKMDGLEHIIFEEAPEGKEAEAELYIVGEDVFRDNKNLKEITFPAHLKGICTKGSMCYNGKLEEVTINGVIAELEAVMGKDESGKDIITGWKASENDITLYNGYYVDDTIGLLYACVTEEDLTNTKSSFDIGVKNQGIACYLGEFGEDEIDWVTKKWVESSREKGRWIDCNFEWQETEGQGGQWIESK